MVAWAPRGSGEEVQFGERKRLVDPLTGREHQMERHTLTAMPLFVLGVPAELLRQAVANQPIVLTEASRREVCSLESGWSACCRGRFRRVSPRSRRESKDSARLRVHHGGRGGTRSAIARGCMTAGAENALPSRIVKRIVRAL